MPDSQNRQKDYEKLIAELEGSSYTEVTAGDYPGEGVKVFANVQNNQLRIVKIENTYNVVTEGRNIVIGMFYMFMGVVNIGNNTGSDCKVLWRSRVGDNEEWNTVDVGVVYPDN
jgi:hypothetical protein